MRPRRRASELRDSRKLATQERFVDSRITEGQRSFDAPLQRGVRIFAQDASTRP